MALDVVRLLDSDFFALTTGDEFKAGVALWCKSWNQLPAGSLPANDRVLAHLSGVGHTGWPDVKDMALHGWIECSDGRLYHPTVAEKAIEAWDRRGEFNEVQENKKSRQQRWRARCKTLAELLRNAGVTPPAGAKLETLEGLCRRHGVDTNETLSEADVDASPSTQDARVDAQTSTRDVSVDQCEIGKTGTGTETGIINIGTSSLLSENPQNPIPANDAQPSTALARVTTSDRLPDGLVQQAFDDWNAMATQCASPKALTLTDDRRRKLASKLKEVGLDGWRNALRRIAASPHCQGENDRGWKADLDFLFQAKSWNRLMEGTYDTRPASRQSNRPAAWDPLQQAIDGIIIDSGDAA